MLLIIPFCINVKKTFYKNKFLLNKIFLNLMNLCNELIYKMLAYTKRSFFVLFTTDLQ